MPFHLPWNSVIPNCDTYAPGVIVSHCSHSIPSTRIGLRYDGGRAFTEAPAQFFVAFRHLYLILCVIPPLFISAHCTNVLSPIWSVMRVFVVLFLFLFHRDVNREGASRA